MKKVYFFASLFAILTGIAVYSYMNSLKTTPVTAQTVQVVVAVKSIPQKTVITSDMVKVIEFPAEAVNSLAVRSLADAVGKVTNSSIESEEQILQTRLRDASNAENGLSFCIPVGKRAMSVEVSDVSGVSGYLQKGDIVDILVSILMDAEDGTGTKISKTVLFLQNIEILATATASQNSNGAGTTGYSTVTLAVTASEAVRLFYAQINGKLTVILRPYLESAREEVGPYAP